MVHALISWRTQHSEHHWWVTFVDEWITHHIRMCNDSYFLWHICMLST